MLDLSVAIFATSYCIKPQGYLPCYPPHILHVYGPEHATTIYGWTFSTGVRLQNLWHKKLQIYIFQIVSSVILTLYTQLVFENIGYAWTFIIMGFIASAGTFEVLINVCTVVHRNKLWPFQGLFWHTSSHKTYHPKIFGRGLANAKKR